MLFLVIAGMGINPFTALSFILLNESAGDDFRQTASISLLATYGLGQLFFILLAYMFPDWQILVLYCIAIPLALQIGTFIWIYESPKFLLSKKEFKKAKEIIYKIAKVNKRTLGLFTFKEQKEYENEIKNDLLEKVKEITTDDFSCLKLRDITDDEFLNATLKNAVKSNDVSVNVENPDFNNQGRFNSTFNEIIKNHIDHNDLFLFHKFPMFRRELKRHHRIYTVLDLLRYASQLKISLILCIVHFSIYLTYYGLIFSLETIGGDVYISALLQTSAELLAYLSINFIIGHIKRRIMLPFCLLAQSLSCLLTLALMNNSQILILAMISRFFIAMALSIATVYTAELYPTTIRSLGIGFTSFVGKFGCAFAPLLGKMFQYTLMLHPMVSYGIVGTFAGFLAIFLKETLGLPLEEEIPELFVEKTERNKNKI